MKNKKNVRTNIKIQIPACMANPSPPIGPVLGQYGVNIMEFCKIFNKKTEHLEKGTTVSVLITVFSDKTFSFIIKTPPASFLLKKIAGIQSGAKDSKEKVGKITKSQIRDIAKIKSRDMTGSNIEAMSRSIEGTAISMGLKIID